MKIIAYARFSPRPNAEECDSVVSQIHDLKEFSSREFPGKRVLEFPDPDSSGKHELVDRGVLLNAIKAVGRDDILLVRDWKRLARNVFVQLTVARTVAKRRARLLSIVDGEWDTDDNVWLMNLIKAGMNELERRTISRRTREKMQKYVLAGRYMGGHAVFGYRLVLADGKRTLEPNAEEQETIGMIFRLRDDENLNWTEIASRLEQAGRTIGGRVAWYRDRVRSVYLREKRRAAMCHA